jgi:hypothetical protein
VADDISEEHDLAAQYPDKVAELLALHEEWAKRYFPNRIPHVKQRSYYTFPKTPTDP